MMVELASRFRMLREYSVNKASREIPGNKTGKDAGGEKERVH